MHPDLSVHPDICAAFSFIEKRVPCTTRWFEISVCPPSSPEVRCTVLQSLGLPLEAPLTRIGIPEILCKLQFRYNYHVHVWGQITGLSKGDALALSYTIHAAKVLDRIFLEQVFLFVWGIFLLGSRIMITL